MYIHVGDEIAKSCIWLIKQKGYYVSSKLGGLLQVEGRLDSAWMVLR